MLAFAKVLNGKLVYELPDEPRVGEPIAKSSSLTSEPVSKKVL